LSADVRRRYRAAPRNHQPVTDRTLFEIGSVSKTFTGLLGAQAAASGKLNWRDAVSQHFTELRGTPFDHVSMLDLATYTAGGLPLQVPDDVNDTAKMTEFYRNWRPAFGPGTHRQYSNASIGLFGHLAARSLGAPFAAWMEGSIFPALGLRDTHLRVPADRMDDYAWGYRNDQPVRVGPGMWDAQAYGVKTTASDLLRFVEWNIDARRLASPLQSAVALTHAGHYRVGDMVQGLGWEMYGAGTPLPELLAGNSSDMALKPHAVVRLAEQEAGGTGMLINKTGSTNGFGAYVLFRRAGRTPEVGGTGVVLLANKNYPNAVRVAAAHRLMGLLG
jgi:beta-lactamase class C